MWRLGDDLAVRLPRATGGRRARAPRAPLASCARCAPAGGASGAGAARVDGAAHLEALWSDAVAAAPWPGPPVWLHGDPHPANLLVAEDRLVALLDLGDLTAGDPATDLATAWLTFDSVGRATFRDRLVERGAVDDATWRRARGWAVVMTTAMLRRPSDEAIAAVGRQALAQLLDEPGPTG